MGPALKEVLITAEQLQARIGELAAQIDADYAGRDLLLVGVLKGAVMVMADLARAMRPAGGDGLDGRLAPTARAPSPPAWSGYSRTWIRTSPAGTCLSSRTSWTPGSRCPGWLGTCDRARPRRSRCARCCASHGRPGYTSRSPTPVSTSERVRGGLRSGLRPAVPESAFHRAPWPQRCTGRWAGVTSAHNPR